MNNRLLPIIFLVTACSATAGAQPVGCEDPLTRVSVVVRDNGTGVDTLWFGFDPTATCGIDPHLCEYESILPPSGLFAAQWRAPNPSDSCEPGYDRDYLPYVSRTAVHRHLLTYNPGEGGYPFTFQWTPANVRAIYDSVVLADLFGGIFVRARMDSVDHVQVFHPAITMLSLTVYGQRFSPWDCTEPPVRAALRLEDPGGRRDTLWWALGQGATCGLDTALCEGGWEEPPPPPVGLFDVRFTGGTCTTGTHRAYLPMACGQIDTVRVHLQHGTAGLPVNVSWDALPPAFWDVDSVILTDVLGGVLFRRNLRDAGQAQITSTLIADLLLLIFHSPLSVEEPASIPVAPELFQNYPNPFNPVTTIRFAVPANVSVGTSRLGGTVSLHVFDVLGRRVATLVDSPLAPGTHTVSFDGTGLAGGIYFCRLTTGGYTATRRMVLLR